MEWGKAHRFYRLADGTIAESSAAAEIRLDLS